MLTGGDKITWDDLALPICYERNLAILSFTFLFLNSLLRV